MIRPMFPVNPLYTKVLSLPFPRYEISVLTLRLPTSDIWLLATYYSSKLNYSAFKFPIQSEKTAELSMKPISFNVLVFR